MIVFLLLLLGAVMNDTSARDVISFNTGWQFKKGPFSDGPYACFRTMGRQVGGSDNSPYLECERYASES